MNVWYQLLSTLWARWPAAPSPGPSPSPSIPQPFEIQLPTAPPKGFWDVWAQPFATIFAGAAALGAAIIAWRAARRNQRELAGQFEKTHDLAIVRGLRDRYTTIGTQLADSTTTVRIAGVYSLAALADEWLQRKNSREAIVCVDLLCSYLRSAYHVPNVELLGGAAKTIRKRIHKNFTRSDEVEEHFESSVDDIEVRQAIVESIGVHVAKGASPSWSYFMFDFKGAHFKDAVLANAVFNGPVYFTGAIIDGLFGFQNTIFADTVRFDNAKFHTTAMAFQDVTFCGDVVDFEEAEFNGGTVSFQGTKFVVDPATYGELDVTFADVAWGDSEVIFEGVEIGDGVQFITGSKPMNVVPDHWPPGSAASPTTGETATNTPEAQKHS